MSGEQTLYDKWRMTSSIRMHARFGAGEMPARLVPHFIARRRALEPPRVQWPEDLDTMRYIRDALAIVTAQQSQHTN